MRPGDRSWSPRHAISATPPNAQRAEERRAATVRSIDSRERVHRVDHARTREERAENRETERRDDERQVPDTQHPAPFLHHHRVDERGRGQPREQRRVLDRVPTPEATPTEHRVAPPRAEHDADREKAPRDQRGAAHRREPPFAEAAGDERGDRERERDRESDVARVEHRRVDRDERMVLQQRVRALHRRAGIAPVTSLNGFAAMSISSEEEQQHAELHERRPRHERIRRTVAEPPQRDARRRSKASDAHSRIEPSSAPHAAVNV